MDNVLIELQKEAQKNCTCQCSSISIVIMGIKMDVRSCWFSVDENYVGGPFKTTKDFENLEEPKIIITDCPKIQVRQDMIQSAVGFILFLARIQHALSRMLGPIFYENTVSLIPTYDLFELVVFKRKNFPEAELARQILDHWKVKFYITPQAAAEVLRSKSEFGMGLCTLLAGIHCMVDNQRRGLSALGSGSKSPSITQIFFSTNWEKEMFPVRFAIVAGNGAAAKVFAQKAKMSGPQMLSLALMCVVIYPLQSVAKAACEFAGVSLQTPEGVTAETKEEEDEDLDFKWAGAAVAALCLGTSKGKNRPDVHMIVPSIGRPLFFFANNRYVARAFLDGGVEVATLKDSEGRGAFAVIRSPEVLELLHDLPGFDEQIANVSKASADGGVSALHAACRDGRCKMIEALVLKGGVSPDAILSGLPPAAMAKDADTLRTLVAVGAKLGGFFTSEGLTLMHIGAQMGWGIENFRAAMELTKGAQEELTVNCKSTKQGSTPIMLARSLDTILALIDLGADTQACDGEGIPVLSCLLSSQLDAMEVIPHLVPPTATPEEIKAFVSAVDGNDRVPLLYCQSAKAVKALLIAGADPMTTFGPLQLTIPSFYAYQSLHECLAEFVRSATDGAGNSLVDLRDKAGKTPLMYVQSAIGAQILIVSGADVNAKCNEGISVTSYFLMTGVDESCLVALAASKQLRMSKPEESRFGITEAHCCSTASAVAFVHRLGGDLKAKTGTGCQPIHAATAAGCTMAIKQIIESVRSTEQKSSNSKVAPDDDVSNSKQTPSTDPLSFFPLQPYRSLLNLFCPFDEWKPYAWMFSQLPTHAAVRGMTPLMWARQKVDVAILAAAGADFTKTTDDITKLTALHFAAARGEVEVVSEILKDKRVDINAKDGRGFTPLDYATLMVRVEVCEVLSAAGAKAPHAAALLTMKA